MGLWKASREFLFSEDGQDLIEYTLLLAFIALASAALFVGTGQGVHDVWSRGNAVLKTANRALRSQHEDD